MIATPKAIRSVPSKRRPLCAGVVKTPLPFVRDLNVVVTRFNAVVDGKVVKFRLMKLHPVDRKALIPLEIAK